MTLERAPPPQLAIFADALAVWGVRQAARAGGGRRR
jgi:hypothetical protein